MLKFFMARFTLIKLSAFPPEIGAALRITLFNLQNMVYGYRVIKMVVGLMVAAEHIMPFVLVYKGRFRLAMLLNES